MTQASLKVDVPEELLALLSKSRLAPRDKAAQVRLALAIHLFLTGEISLGKAAELTAETRADFEALLHQLGLPSVQYSEQDFQNDLNTSERLRRQPKSV